MVVNEDFDNKVLVVTSEKRKRQLRVFVPKFGNYSFWRITYEDGNHVPGLEGVFLSRREALRAIELWENNTKVSREVYRDEIFGPANPPVLKRKNIKRASVDKPEAS